MLSFEKVMEQSGLGFARHKVIYDKEGKPVDYSFLSVNPAFERLTGLKKKELLNHRITEIQPNITDEDFDWIDFYGQIASNGERHVFEQYSTPLDRWYRVEVFSYEKGCFTTVFFDITHERELVEASKSFLDDREGTNTYEELTHRLRRITGARFVALNLFLEEKGKFRTSAVVGVSASLQKALGYLGLTCSRKNGFPFPDVLNGLRKTLWPLLTICL